MSGRDDVNFGLSGMRKLVDQLADPQGWAARFATPEALAGALMRLHDCLEFEYGAPGAMRPLYAAFLAEAAPLADPRLLQAATLYRKAGAAWSALAAEAADHSGQGDARALLDRLAACAARALSLEERAVRILLEVSA